MKEARAISSGYPPVVITGQQKAVILSNAKNPCIFA
jgi:hypothetical protein